mmetsp:Transcript_57774/g.137538  ORF Transcript_57774/g.137538 Transcript_57774/m.137538 type:complete len:290 (-) Transcript_57774:56-925(-)|eukprot:CAMPEP_0178421774 /NCGR_PEP_ID=MMETSP0689_2-20121128/26823_1 /TAXON_ID=160604 /ORGANISM="Amphidinium massartii, Strain CS-259" /LENGTH=289 /DNA_ID=CAMNT_0020043301 /DNA_START=58 /DNA_END=927 /DNA_ORIENTATION=-
MSGQDTFIIKIVGAASQGAVGAMVGASLSAVTEPVVNKILVERKPVAVALKEHTLDKIMKFFATTVPTNFIKFPFFEVVNVIMSSVDVPASIKGTVTGIVFTSATLPITNYRFKKSMNQPIDGIQTLYQAYLPTVGRDVVYGIVRNKVTAWLMQQDPKAMATPGGRAKAMFLTVLAACVASAPGNELRGFVLQPKGREKPFLEFFDPVKTVRSTTIGGLIMATSLAIGAFSTPFVERWVSKIRETVSKDPLGALLVILVVLDRLFMHRQLKALTAEAGKGSSSEGKAKA